MNLFYYILKSMIFDKKFLKTLKKKKKTKNWGEHHYSLASEASENPSSLTAGAPLLNGVRTIESTLLVLELKPPMIAQNPRSWHENQCEGKLPFISRKSGQESASISQWMILRQQSSCKCASPLADWMVQLGQEISREVISSINVPLTAKG